MMVNFYEELSRITTDEMVETVVFGNALTEFPRLIALPRNPGVL